MASSSTNLAPRAYSIPPLTAKNYSTWSIKIEMLLIRSELWSVVDGSEVCPPASEAEGYANWTLKDSKARSDILLHCGEKQLITLRPLTTSKAVWDKIKLLYEKSNKASQVHLHKQLCRMTMTDSDDVSTFLESWQAILQEAAISGCTFTEAQQVNLLLGALPDSWGAFVTTQGGITDLTFTNLLSNILQQDSINMSRNEQPKSSAFYAKGKFQKTRQFQSTQSKFRKPYLNNTSSNKTQSTQIIICHYCGKPGHKAPECRKKQRDLGTSKYHTNNLSTLELFSAEIKSDTGTPQAWYLDSGASQHMSPLLNLFQKYKVLDSPKTILLGDNSSQQAEGYGSVILQLTNGQLLSLHDVLYVPGLAKNLISVIQLINTGNTIVIFTKEQCIIKSKSPNSKNNLVIKIRKDGNLFSLGEGMVNPVPSYVATTSSKLDLSTKWHNRLGHLNIRSLATMQSHNLVIGLPQLQWKLPLCTGCVYGKHHRFPYPTDFATRATEVLALVHTDLCGPMKTPSLGGATYFLIFIDDYSRYTYVYFLKKKSGVFHQFTQYKALVENHTDKKILILRSDNGGEFTSNSFNKFCEENGIQRHFTNPYNPAQNGVSERKNRTLVESARSMIQTAQLSNAYWAEAIQTACYLQNCSFTSSIQDSTPHELWTGLKPDLTHLRIFGCSAYSQIPDNKRAKLDTKALKCIFVGYGQPLGVKGYRLYHPDSKKLFFSRDVIFHEDQILSGTTNEEPDSAQSQSELNSDPVYLILDKPQPFNMADQPNEQHDNEDHDNSDFQVPTPSLPQTLPTSIVSPKSTSTSPTPAHQINMSPHLRAHLRQNSSPSKSTIRKSERANKGTWKSTKFHDEAAYAYFTEVADPSSVSEALSSTDASHWRQAMESEYSSLMKNKTWILVDPPPQKSIVSTKWIFRRKYNSDGTIARYKARFVARGFSQQPGLDYSETFSPVIKITSLRLLLALATIYDYHVHQMDVTTAFLNGILQEDIYITQPESFVIPGNENKVCHLLKSLYGLKQAPRVWYDLFDKFLLSQGFLRCSSDNNVYIKRSTSTFLFLGLYVDDLILISSDLKYLTLHKAIFAQRFSMIDNNEIQYLLGIQLRRDRQAHTLILSQDKYIADILNKFKMDSCKPISTPLEAGIRFSKTQAENLTPDQASYMSSVPYAQALGSLQYLVTCTRPDLAFSVHHLAQFMAHPGPPHWTALKRIFRYLQHTNASGLIYRRPTTKTTNNLLCGWSDADWAGDIDTRRSTSGYYFQLQGATISWQSKKQPVVALSSTEAEYISAATATKELLWLQSILSELGYPVQLPSVLYCDNQSCISLTKNPKFHERSKHIDIKYHFLREKVDSKLLQLEFTPTSEMWADVLTKSLSKSKHEACIQAQGLTGGGVYKSSPNIAA